MNAFTLLKADHKKVASILEKLESTTERGVKTRQELFAQLKTELEIHTRIEETVFYPALEKQDETRDITLEAVEEHRIVKRLLAELESLAKDDEQWTYYDEAPMEDLLTLRDIVERKYQRRRASYEDLTSLEKMIRQRHADE